VRQGTRAYFAANLTAQASALARYIVLARILGPEQLGLAAMLILTSQFFESISDTGSDRFLVQDADGDSPRLQGLVQLVLAGRGLLIATALIVSAPLLSGLYRAPTLETSLMWLALSPFIGGFVHLDLRRAQRTQDFRPESAAIIVAELVSLAGTATAAFITRDHTAVIYGLVLRSLALVVVSHITARRPYRWAYGRDEGVRFSMFAAPLFLNGLLLFLGSQGDRLMVGSGLGAAALGHYSAILLLIYYPTSALSKFVMGIHLPHLAARREEAAVFAAAREKLGGQTVLLAIGVTAGFLMVAPMFTPLFYGRQFAQPLQIFALLGVLQAARFLRLWPTTLAVGIGRSSIVMLNNVARMIALPTAFLANLYFHSLESIVGGFIVGEIVALLAALWLLARANAVVLRHELLRVAEFVVAGALVIAWALALHAGDLILLPFVAAASVLAMLVVAQRERPTLTDAWGLARNRLGRYAQRLDRKA
jgi:O-antigen/teichoic acid export membrane protein